MRNVFVLFGACIWVCLTSFAEAKPLLSEKELQTKILESKSSKRAYYQGLYGHWLLKTGKNKEAFSLFQKLLKQDKKHFHACVGMAQFFLSEGQPEKAKRYLERQQGQKQAILHSAWSAYYREKAQQTTDLKAKKRWIQKSVERLGQAIEQKPKVLKYRQKRAFLNLANQNALLAHYDFLFLRSQKPSERCYSLGVELAEAFLSSKVLQKIRSIESLQQQCPEPSYQAFSKIALQALVLRRAEKLISLQEWEKTLSFLTSKTKEEREWNAVHRLLVLLLYKKKGCKEVKSYIKMKWAGFSKQQEKIKQYSFYKLCFGSSGTKKGKKEKK